MKNRLTTCTHCGTCYACGHKLKDGNMTDYFSSFRSLLRQILRSLVLLNQQFSFLKTTSLNTRKSSSRAVLVFCRNTFAINYCCSFIQRYVQVCMMLDRCQVSESLTSIIPEPLLLTSPSLMSRDTETNPYKVSSELHSLICLKVVFTWNLWDDLS